MKLRHSRQKSLDITIRPETNSNDFCGFLKLIIRFEFDFRRRGNSFFERSEFLVCSKFNHMQRNCPCACAVACLCHTIAFRMLWCPCRFTLT